MVTASAERARKPVIQYQEREEFRAVVLATAARLLAGAVMVRLIRASRPARPGPATGPPQHLAGLTEAQACGSSVRSRPAGSGVEGDAD